MNILKSICLGCLLAYSLPGWAITVPASLGVCVAGDRSYNGARQNSFIVELQDASGPKSNPVTLPSANDTDYVEFTVATPQTISLSQPGHHQFSCHSVALKPTTRGVQIIVNYGDNGLPTTCLIRIRDDYESQADCLDT